MNKYDVMLMAIVVAISAAVAMGMKGGGAPTIASQQCIDARKVIVETRACDANAVCTQSDIIRRSRALEEVKESCTEVE